MALSKKQTTGIDMDSLPIENVPDPTNAQDAATKQYVDDNSGGSGDVVGPASSTDNAIARFDSTTGKLLQNSILRLEDNGDISGASSFALQTDDVESGTTASGSIYITTGAQSDEGTGADAGGIFLEGGNSSSQGGGEIILDAGSGVVDGVVSIQDSQLVLGTPGNYTTNDVLTNLASYVRLSTDSVTGKRTVSFPDAAGTLVLNSNTQTLTNKTLTSPVINTPTGIVKGDVGLGNVDNTSDATKNSATATLTNKTITAPVLSGTVTGTYTLGGTPTFPSTVVSTTGTQTLTNKTIAAGNNTITGLTNANLGTGAGELGGAWNTWTPTWSNYTVGNGTVVARYTQVGKTVRFRILVTLGTTSSMGSIATFTLPVTAVSSGYSANDTVIANGSTRDATGSLFPMSAVFVTTGTAGLRYVISTGTFAGVSSTAPFTWAVNDNISLSGEYEAT